MPLLTVATWNMSHAVKRGSAVRAKAWAHLASLRPDIALVQEGGGPSGAPAEIPDPAQGALTRVVSYGPVLEPVQPVHPSWNRALGFRIPDNARPGTLAIATADLGERTPLVSISLYGELRYADQSVLRAVGDLIPLFDSTLGRRVILGGDLNIHTHSNNAAERRRAKPILDLIEAVGLLNLTRVAKRRGVLEQGVIANASPCPCDGTDCYHVKTHHRPNQVPGAMASNDYLFGTEWVAQRLEGLRVMNGDSDPAWTHSDHVPMTVSLRV